MKLKKIQISKKLDSSSKVSEDQKSETSLKSPLVGTAYLSPEPGSNNSLK